MDRTNPARRVPTDDEFLIVTLSTESATQSYPISRPSLETAADVRWVPAGETVQVGGTTISGGMFYVGTPRRSDAYSLDGCVLNEKANISQTASDLSKGPENYWLSYDAFSAKERRAYIQWLASDRSAPDLHHSFSAFYLHGLERRILVDAAQGKVGGTSCRGSGISCRGGAAPPAGVPGISCRGAPFAGVASPAGVPRHVLPGWLTASS
ncbi:TerB N-terminal domain-containing protein [Ralstonia mannitolilytica]